MVGKFGIVRLSAAALALCGAGAAQAGTIGIAAGYNEFILGNVSYQNSDVQGKIAVGGNLTVSSTSLSDKAGAGNNVIVGGNFTATNGSVTGNVIAGGNVNYTNPTVNGSVSAGGSVTFDPNSGGAAPTSVRYGTTFTKPSWMSASAQQGTTTVPIDFNAEFNNLKNISLAQVKSSDPYGLFQYSQAYFNAGSGTGVKAFNVSASTLMQATGGYNISADAGATVVINVSGTSAELFNTGYNLSGGLTADHVIWNFYEATSLLFDGSVVGSVLAPKAAVTASYGGLNGTLIAASLAGAYGSPTSIEAHTQLYGGGASDLFNGTLRDIASAGDTIPVPEPGMLALFGLAAVALVAARRMPDRKTRVVSAA